jgi:hypothetical protein
MVFILEEQMIENGKNQFVLAARILLLSYSELKALRMFFRVKNDEHVLFTFRYIRLTVKITEDYVNIVIQNFECFMQEVVITKLKT